MQDATPSADEIVAFARKLETFARTRDGQEQVWLADLVQAAVNAVADLAEERDYNLQEGEATLQVAEDTSQANLSEGLLTGVPTTPVASPV